MNGSTPRHRRQRHAKRFNLTAVVLGLLASGAVVLTASQAAFSDTTSNSSSSFSTGNVDLVDDDSGSAAFTVTNMVPGQSVTRCILVTYQGSIADPKRGQALFRRTHRFGHSRIPSQPHSGGGVRRILRFLRRFRFLGIDREQHARPVRHQQHKLWKRCRNLESCDNSRITYLSNYRRSVSRGSQHSTEPVSDQPGFHLGSAVLRTRGVA